MNNRFDARRFQDRKTFVSKFNAFVDFVKIIGQEFMPEIPRRAVNRPGFTGLFIKTDAQSAAFLSQIAFAGRVHDMGMFMIAVVNFGNIIRDDILMFHRMQGQVNTRHRAHFACP